MEHEKHVTELLPGYALGCLDAEEAAQVVEHLAVCEHCQAELDAFQAVANQLAMAAPDAQPSPGLKTRILQQIQPETPLPQKQARFAGWRQRIAAWFQSGIRPKWAFANALVMLMLAASTLLFWQRLHSLEQRYQTQDFQMVRLECTHVVPEAAGQILISRDGEFGILTVAHLPVLDADQTYQVWLNRKGERIPGGTFSVNRNGYGVLKLISAESLLDCGFSITVEPADGSVAPTGKTVLQNMV